MINDEEWRKEPLPVRYFRDCDMDQLPFTLILKWKDGSIFDREDVENLFNAGYIYRTVYEATLAEINRINDMYDSR